MKIDKYKCSFPGNLWVVILDYNEPLGKIVNKFNFYKMDGKFNQFNEEIETGLLEDRRRAIAGCYPVMEKSGGDLGILCLVFMIDLMNANTIAHESVHIADYYYEVGGIYSESFSDGNESYAYLVGWSAGNISKTVIDYERRRDKKQQERI